MRKEIYRAIAERLNTSILGINYISLWNNNTEQLTAQSAFRMPAVFVEFESIDWTQFSGGARSAQMRVRLHIVTETLATPEAGGKYQDNALEHLDLIESISRVMQGLAGNGFNGFLLVESLTDHDHERIEDNQECYITQITDLSGIKPQTVARVVTLVQG